MLCVEDSRNGNLDETDGNVDDDTANDELRKAAGGNARIGSGNLD
jgi:hypothetical protein